MTNLLSSADISIFFTGNQQLLLYLEIQIQIAFSHIISDFFNFEYLKVVLINMVVILMMSAKLAALGLYKIKVF